MRTASEMIRAANAQTTNTPAACQHNTWVLYQSHAVGDVDHDGDADAVDGWKSEPASARHTDRKPMIGAPGAWSGGSGGFGHRAPCVGYDKNGEPLFRSTDAGGRGVMATKPLSFFEEVWGLHWLGWSETISGDPIKGLWKHVPDVARPEKPKPKTRGTAVDAAIKSLSKAKAKKGTPRDKHLSAARAELHAIPFIK